MSISAAAQSVEDFFAGGVPAVKFPDGAFGTVIGGVITSDPRMQQQRDYTSGEPVVYQDGNPAMQMVITVQTDLRDPAIDGDDGQRAFYVKGQMRQAIGEALRKANARKPERGGRLLVKYIEDKPTTLKNGKPGNPQKIYAAKYEPPAGQAAGQFFDEAPAPAMDPLGGGPILRCPPGVDPRRWAEMTLDQRRQMYDALGLDDRGNPLASVPERSFTEEPPF